MSIGKNMRQRRRELGYTLEEVAQQLGTSKQTIQRYESGKISNIPSEKIAQIAAFLEISPSVLVGWSSEREEATLMPLRTRRVPMLGEIACGEPIWAEEEHGSYVSVDESLSVDFCLRAHGDSMIGARIHDGDLVLVRKQDSVDNGEIGVVIIDGEATLKRVYYYPGEAKLILSPENPRYAPLVYLGAELDGVMNYPVRKGIIDFLTSHSTSTLYYALTDIINNAPKRISDMQMNLLGTHDTERILTVLGGERPEGRSNEYLSKKKMNDLERGTAKRRLRMAYTVLATVPGIPAIFYGDEAGLEGYHDPFNRMPYPWGHEDHNLIAFYQKIGNIRRTNDVYREGEFELIHIDEDTLVFARYDDEYSYVTFVNNSKQNRSVHFSSEADVLILDKTLTANVPLELAAYSAQIFKTKRHSDIYF